MTLTDHFNVTRAVISSCAGARLWETALPLQKHRQFGVLPFLCLLQLIFASIRQHICAYVCSSQFGRALWLWSECGGSCIVELKSGWLSWRTYKEEIPPTFLDPFVLHLSFRGDQNNRRRRESEQDRAEEFQEICVWSVSIWTQTISGSNVSGVFPVHEPFCFCLVQVCITHFWSFCLVLILFGYGFSQRFPS